LQAPIPLDFRGRAGGAGRFLPAWMDYLINMPEFEFATRPAISCSPRMSMIVSACGSQTTRDNCETVISMFDNAASMIELNNKGDVWSLAALIEMLG